MSIDMLELLKLLKSLKNTSCTGYDCPFNRVLIQGNFDSSIESHKGFDIIFESPLDKMYPNCDYFIRDLLDKSMDFCNEFLELNMGLKEETFACLKQSLEEHHLNLRYIFIGKYTPIHILEDLRDIPEPILHPEDYTVTIYIAPLINTEESLMVLKSYPLNNFQTKKQFRSWIESEMADYEDESEISHNSRISYNLRILLTNKITEAQYEYKFLSDKLEKR